MTEQLQVFGEAQQVLVAVLALRGSAAGGFRGWGRFFQLRKLSGFQPQHAWWTNLMPKTGEALQLWAGRCSTASGASEPGTKNFGHPFDPSRRLNAP